MLVLDWVLGSNHSVVYKRAELRELMDYHIEGGEDGGSLNKDEVNVIKGALSMSEKSVFNIITPLDDIFMLSVDEVLNQETMDRLLSYGHSRVPVYRNDRTNIIGLVLVKRLINIDALKSTPINDLKLTDVVVVDASASIWSVLNTFQTGKSHMAVVKKINENEVEPTTIGIVTLEDIFEELIQQDIQDETDIMVNVQRKSLTEMLHKITKPIKRTLQLPMSNVGAVEIEMDTHLLLDSGSRVNVNNNKTGLH
jgi:metal transporter CNNM